MKKRIFLTIWVLGLVLPILATATSPTLPTDCKGLLVKETPYTLAYLSDAAREDIKVARVTQPKRNFFDLDTDLRIKRKGGTAPKALQEIVGPKVKFMAVPSVMSPTDITVGDPEEGSTIPLRVDMKWQGEDAGTLAYFTLPKNTLLNTSAFIVGPEYKFVDIHLHGGGTQNARAENSNSLGTPLAKRDIATIGIGLPGHDDALAGNILLMEQICDWLMKFIEETVHPDVKITLSGHSWGAMIAIYLRNHSDNPKYARIRNAIAISPGVDITLGGDVRKKLEFDRWYDEHYDEFEKEIAPGDFEFLKTSVEADKLSTLAAYATVASQLDYTTPVMTLEQQKSLIDLNVITGKADGLVYVGREEQYQLAWGNLKEGSNLTLLEPGLTFKSKDDKDLIKTGHQVFDVYIPGTTTPLVYKMVGDIILKGDNTPKVAPVETTKIQNLLNEITRQYAHFFPFRKLVENFVRYKRSPTPNLKVVSGYKRSLDEYVNKYNSMVSKNNQEKTKAIQKATEELRAEVGLTDKIDIVRAQEELNFPPQTPERMQILQNFIQNAGKIEEALRLEGNDSQYTAESQQLWDTHSEFLFTNGIQDLADYAKLFAEYQNLKKDQLTPEKKKTRTRLATIDQEMKRLESEKANRYGQERARRIAKLGQAHGLSDTKAASRELATRPPERKAKVQAFVDKYPNLLAKVDEEFGSRLQAELAKLEKPKDVNNAEEAMKKSQDQEKFLGMMYAIPNQPEIETLAAAISKAIDEKDAIQKGSAPHATLDKLEAIVRDLKAEREKLIKRWDIIVKARGFASSKIQSQLTVYAAILKELKAHHKALGMAIDEYLQEQYLAHGTLNKKMIEDRPQSLRDAEDLFMNTRNRFLVAKADLAAIYLSEAIAEQVVGTSAAEAEHIAKELDPNAPMSLTSRVLVLDSYVEKQREQESILGQQRERMHWEYAQLLKRKGIVAPYEVERIEVYSLLDLPLPELLEKLDDDPALVEALQDLMNVWKPLAKKLRNENQLSD